MHTHLYLPLVLFACLPYSNHAVYAAISRKSASTVTRRSCLVGPTQILLVMGVEIGVSLRDLTCEPCTSESFQKGHHPPPRSPKFDSDFLKRKLMPNKPTVNERSTEAHCLLPQYDKRPRQDTLASEACHNLSFLYWSCHRHSVLMTLDFL